MPLTVKDPAPRGRLILVSSQMLPLPEMRGIPSFFTFRVKLALVWSASRVPDPTTVAFPGMSIVAGVKPVILACVELDPQSL